MRVILLGDLHLGARGGSDGFSDYFNLFFTDVLYPYMKKNKIDTIFQLGDLFDNRTALSMKAFHKCKPVWFEQLVKNNFTMYTLLGNHDIHFKNTLRVNSQELHLGEFNTHIHVIKKPTNLILQNTSMDIIPWVCAENTEEVDKFVKRQGRGSVLLGHLELAGFPMYRGNIALHGTDAKMFENYPAVFTGHYHTHSSNENITYTGIPYEITWSDYADPKGFYVFDTEYQTAEFVTNPSKMFYKFTYNDGCDADLTVLSDFPKYVKIIVQSKKDPIAFERFVDSVRLHHVADLNIVDTSTVVINTADEELEEKDTRDFIMTVVDELTTTVDKAELKSFMSMLYQEALFAE